MEKRRISFTFGVTYDTPLKKLKKIQIPIRQGGQIPNKSQIINFQKCRILFTLRDEN